MARPSTSELERRIAQLEAENESLRLGVPVEATVPATEPADRPKRGRGWAVLSVALITIGAVLAPVAVVSTWAKNSLTDTDRFVATFAPLARDHSVRQYVTDQTVAVINERIDIPQLTSDLFDGITELGTPPRATAAIEALKGPAASGVQSLIESRVATFVESETFADVWTQALRISHRQLVAAMANDPDAALRLGGDGTIGIQLAPIIDAVKSALVDQGIGFASQIPSVDRTITVAQSDALPAAQLGYGAAVVAGVWMPWVALGFLAAGVLVARRRSTALISASIVLAVVMAALAIGLAIARAVFVTSVSPSILPTGVSQVLFDRVAGGMRATTVSVIVLAVVVAVVGWFAGPFDTPRRLRALARSAAGEVRRFGEERNVTTGRVGAWIYRQRVLLRALVAVIAALVVVFGRPVSPPLIIWTLVIAALAIAVLELVQRPPAEESVGDAGVESAPISAG